MPPSSLLHSGVIARHVFGLTFGCVLAVGFANMGCSPDTRRSASDTGPRARGDSGIIVVSDSGPGSTRRDSGPITLMDSGPPPPPFDAGPPPPPPGSCRLDAFTQLPAACLPRCSSSTEAALSACTDSDCFAATLEADTTPPTTLTLPDATTTTLDCQGCVGQQVQSCWFELCQTSFLAFDECRRGGGACTAENDALSLCRGGSSVIECENTRLAGCFG